MLSTALFVVFLSVAFGYFVEQNTCGPAKNQKCSNVGTSSGNVVCAGAMCPVYFTYTGPTGYYFKNKRFARVGDDQSNIWEGQCTVNAIAIDGQPLKWVGTVTPKNCYFYKEDVPPPPPAPPVQYYAEQNSCGQTGTSPCSNVGINSGNPMCAGSNCPKTFTYTGVTGYYFKGQKMTRAENEKSNIWEGQCTQNTKPIDGQAISWTGAVSSATCYQYNLAPPSPPPPAPAVIYYTEQNTCGPEKNQKCSNVGIVSGNVICGGSMCPKTFTYIGPVGYYFKNRLLSRPADGTSNLNPWQCTTAAKPIDGQAISWTGTVTARNCYIYR